MSDSRLDCHQIGGIPPCFDHRCASVQSRSPSRSGTQPTPASPNGSRTSLWTARIRVPAARWHSIIYGAVLLLAAAGSFAFFGPIALSVWAVFGVLIAVACLAADSLKAGLGPPPEEPSCFSASETATVESCAAGYPAPTTRTDQERAEELCGWSDHALCWAWRTSYVRMQRGSRHHMMWIAIERRAYLDELERRNPTAFDAWRTSGARAPSDPSRYFIPPGGAPRAEAS